MKVTATRTLVSLYCVIGMAASMTVPSVHAQPASATSTQTAAPMVTEMKTDAAAPAKKAESAVENPYGIAALWSTSDGVVSIR